MVGALRFLTIFLIGLTSAQCPTPCSLFKVFKVDAMCGPPGDQFHCGGQWRLQTPIPHPRCTITTNRGRINVCMYRRLEDNKEYCFCDPGNSIYEQNLLSGKSCDRDCRAPTMKKKTCDFLFILENLQSHALGRKVLMYNRKLPGPPITVCEGDDVVVGLINNLKDLVPSPNNDPRLPPDSTTLHFHGIRQKQKSSSHYEYSEGGGPWSDGVPLVTQCPIPSCHKSKTCTFTYKFLGSGTTGAPYKNAPAGTYWYHSHVGTQRLNGAAGKLIIMPKNYRSDDYDRDLIDDPKNSLFLQEWYEEWYEGNGLDFPTGLLVNGKEIQNNDIEVFHVKPGKRHRFRIIGGNGNYFPIRVSIENHTFTVIATDSIDMELQPDIDALWIAAGERYDIVIETKNGSEFVKAYKIKFFSNIDDTTEMEEEEFKKVLNPVPDNITNWHNENKYIYPRDFTALTQADNVNSSLNSHNINMPDNTFNNLKMKYPDIPFLYQSAPNDTNQCSNDTHTNPAGTKCENVIRQPWNDTEGAEKPWFEIILINPSKTAHPIHHHSGWFNIVGMDQFDSDHDLQHKINSGGLSRNFTLPVFKDTIQVPTNGYVIFRAPIDNAGVWIVHCHINSHFEAGMAMVFQIGEPNQWSMGPNQITANANKNFTCPGL